MDSHMTWTQPARCVVYMSDTKFGLLFARNPQVMPPTMEFGCTAGINMRSTKSPLIVSVGRLFDDPTGLLLQILLLFLQFLVDAVKSLSLHAKSVDLFAQRTICLQQLAELVVCLRRKLMLVQNWREKGFYLIILITNNY